MNRDIDDDSRPERHLKYRHCKDRMCGADDCPTCRPDTYDHAQNSDEREEQEQFEKYGTIKTSHIFPPIPDRSHDWMAFLDDRDDGPTGFGATKADAIADLKQQIDDEE